MQFGVGTHFAWLGKANELRDEFGWYHFHNFNGDVIYRMTLQMILLQILSDAMVLQYTSWRLCCFLLSLVFMTLFESVVPVKYIWHIGRVMFTMKFKQHC
jgi:hypothetical protein